jgi:acyl-coenzyme A thioesterase PaaI-like protein
VTRLSSEGGQATVELVALLPLAVAAGLAGATILAAQSAAEHAGQAAHAGVIALLQDRDARAAARTALPEGTEAEITVRGRRVTVTVEPNVPLLAPALSATTSADAGPEPTP